jgi:hypothetical protein
MRNRASFYRKKSRNFLMPRPSDAEILMNGINIYLLTRYGTAIVPVPVQLYVRYLREAPLGKK